MSISNRRTGKIGPPPGSYDTEWLNRLRILLEELGGRLVPADYLGHSQWGWRGQDPGDVGLQDYDTPFRILAANTSIDESPNQMTVRYSWEQILTPHDQRNIIRDNAQENDGPYPVVMVYLGDIGTDPIDSQYDESGAWRYKGIKSGDGVVTISESDDYIELSAPGAVPTSRTITAGDGLSGGGDLTLDRTINLDVSDLTAETSPVSGDYVPLYDVSASATRKVTLSNLLTDTTHRHSVVSFTATNQGGVTIQAGQPVRISSGLNGVELAQGNSLGSCAAGVAETQITVGATGTIVVQGLINVANWTSATGASDLVGGRWFLSAGAAGILTQTPPTVEGNYVQYIGQAITARYLLVKVESPLGL